MSMTQWAVENSRVTVFAVALLFISGLAAYVNLPKAQDPGFTIRTVTVTTAFPGASAERVEQLVTDAIEEKIQEMPEVEEITSESQTGLSVITVDFFSRYMDMQPIFDDLRQKVEDVTPDLPAGVVTPVVNDEFGDTYGHLYSIVAPGFSAALLRDIALDVRDILLKEPDVAKVNLFGDINETIYIEYDNARLSELGVSPQQLEQLLGALNILSSGGEVIVGSERIALEPSGNFNNVNDLRQAILQLPDNDALIRLGDVADVYRDYVDPVETLVRIDGQRGISLAISMRDGGNLLALGERLRTLIPAIESDLPLGVSITPMYQQSVITSQSVDDFVSNLVQAVVIVIVVMVLSLGLRTGLVVASLIPIVMVSTFVFMSQFSIGIDRISLAALIIALGLLVDNAIVVVEATIVRRAEGEAPVEACINAAKEMMAPLLISSLTTAAAFTPIAMAKSEIGEFTSSIFYVVTIALLLSWVFSMTFVPMMTPLIKVDSRDKEQDQEAYNTRFYVGYRRLLIWSVNKPWSSIVIVIILFALAVQGLKFVPKVFIPPAEDPHLTIELSLPTGTDIYYTETVIKGMETHLNESLMADPQDPESLGVTGWTAYIGNGGPRFVLAWSPANPNEAEAAIILNVNNSASLDWVKENIEQYFFEQQPDAQIQIKRLANGPPVSYPIEIKLSGPEYQVLFDLSSQIKSALWAFDEVSIITDSWGPQSKKLLVNVDQARAYRAGVSNQDIATSLDASLSGLELTEYREGDEVIPIVMRTLGNARNDLTKLESLSVFSQSSGAIVPLNQVADVQIIWEPSRIKRLNRERMVTIQVQLIPGITAAEVSARFRPWLTDFQKTWPEGYVFEEGGETDESEKASSSIVEALPAAAIAIVMLLILQFNSGRRTAIVLVTIPLGLIGIVVGLIIAQSVFGFFTFLGLISLAGIVINNAIVLLDRIKLEIEENGLSPSQAVIQAAQQRARPILLTTATTVGGMLPLWLDGGPMFEPMAVAILFGLLFATFITLLLVPVLYSLLFGVKYT